MLHGGREPARAPPGRIAYVFLIAFRSPSPPVKRATPSSHAPPSQRTREPAYAAMARGDFGPGLTGREENAEKERVAEKRPGAHLLYTGCLWHPERDVFCLVFKDSARIYVVNEENSELQEVKTITPFAGVCCIEGLDGDRYVCTVELPLDSMVVRSRSERYLMDQNRGPLETLLNIHAATEGPLEGSSQLFLLQWNPDTDKPEVRSWDELYGILSPDLLAVECVRKRTSFPLCGVSPAETDLSPLLFSAVQPSSSLIVVGSNSCHTLYVYSIIDEQLEKLHDINLPKEERPKGVTIHNQEALLMMAKLPEEERQVLSLPRSEFVEYEVVLQGIPLSGHAASHHGGTAGHCTLQSLLGQAAAKSSASLDFGRLRPRRQNLPKEERPKGVTIHNQEALLMMAKLPEEERQVLSLPRSEFVEYEVVLQGIPLSGHAASHHGGTAGHCTLQSLLGQAAAKSSASLDSAVSDPVARYSRGAPPHQGPASTASSSHLLAGAGELNRCDPAATMTWPRGLLGDLKSHLQATAPPPPRPSSSATSESHLAHRAQARRSVRAQPLPQSLLAQCEKA
ncbi:hypothetical protein HPB48_016953 [Haemaphysalis longicornis]|uniref:WD repeat and coiled-coil-containing protein n=1 Tax=Haemaphysalis longicornis TaxID=44386 RepID=A0A9J6H4K7_HAELO|nr:hypothetical protein HPB48_016953 [Haemaphysalis longicornis]